MRITNQILSNTALKGGMTFQRRTLLDMLGSSSTTTFKSSASSYKTNKTDYGKLDSASQKLKESAEKLSATGEKSLFAKAAESGDTKDVVSTVSSLVEQYNRTLKQLSTSNDAIGKLYKQELVGICEENKDALKEIGIGQNKDGSLSIDENVLESADVETLKKVFGKDSTFTSRLGAVSRYVNRYADANIESTAYKYGADGSYISTSSAKYNFWG